MTKDPADLSKLHDIVVPDAVSWWPPAPGWWVLIVLVLLLVLVLAIRQLRHWRADAYRRAALAELDRARTAEDAAILLRRTALAIAPRDEIARLHGDDWTRWLAERSATPPNDEVRALLATSLYEPARRGGSIEPLRDFARDWIRHHSRPC